MFGIDCIAFLCDENDSDDRARYDGGMISERGDIEDCSWGNIRNSPV